MRLQNGTPLTVAGIVLVRQRPGSAKGVVFMTLEDETGSVNVIVWPKVLERFRPIVLGARFVAVEGRLQAAEGVIHVVAERLVDITRELGALSEETQDAVPPIEALAHADEVRGGCPPDPRLGFVKDKERRADRLADAKKHAAGVLPLGRNFH
jgi:error-prone DNA polymerase